MVKMFAYRILLRIRGIIRNVFRNWEEEGLGLTAKLIMHSDHWNKDVTSTEELEEKEFRVYSQWGDDGLIQFLVKKLNVTKKFFIEFGVADFFESNSHFLLVNNNF